jgi:hypothetical protein
VRRKWWRSPLGFVVGLGIGFAVVEIADEVREDGAADPADVRVAGTPDFIGYCRSQNTELPDASVVSNDAWGWRCVGVRNGVFGRDEIVVDDVCILQFGSDARAELVNAASPDGWQCVVPA